MKFDSIIHKIRSNKKRSITIGIVLFFAIIIGFRLANSGTDAPQEDSIPSVSVIDLADIQNNQAVVKATGEVESLDQVELKSEVSARVTRVRATLGKKVRAGEILVQFDNAGLVAQRSQAYASLQAAQAGVTQVEAGYEAQQANLNELLRGPRSEDLNIARSNVQAAENSLLEAQKNLENVEDKAASDVDAVHASALAAAQKAMATAESALYAFTNLQQTYFPPGNADELVIQTHKATAVRILLGADNAGRWTNENLATLQGGAKAEIMQAQLSTDHSDIKQAVDSTIAGLQALSSAYTAMPVKSEFSTTDATTHSTQRQAILGEILSLTAKRDAIPAQRQANQNLIQAAQSAIVSADNAVTAAEEQLLKVQAGASSEQLDAQRAQVKQSQAGYDAQRAQVLSARAQIASINAQIAKTIVRSPISGTIAGISAKVGELYSPGQQVASVVNTNGLQVRAFIDAASLHNVSIGDAVVIGQSTSGTVHHIAPSIDPQNKKVEVIVLVNDPDDATLVVGEFVDIAIQVQRIVDNQTIVLPLRAIRVEHDNSYVYSINEDAVVERHMVTTGRVIGEEIEILSGLENLTTIISSVRGVRVGEEVTIREF